MFESILFERCSLVELGVGLYEVPPTAASAVSTGPTAAAAAAAAAAATADRCEADCVTDCAVTEA